MRKQISILGSTGSIGRQTLDIISDTNRFSVYALACHHNIDQLIEQAERYSPVLLVVYDKAMYEPLKSAAAHLNCRVSCGMEGLVEAATADPVDIVLTSVVGSIGLMPTIEAIKAKKTIALANKETLVTAGEIIMPLAAAHGVSILPVDSEHSAIFQCLQGQHADSVDEILLTASGGPFRTLTKSEIAVRRASDALKHPNWAMGAKITIDSATLMNKGLEFIEAKWLFGVSAEQIKVIVHPQSIIHSMVRYKDQSIIAQLGAPDMRVPIIYALDYPNRYPNKLEKLDFFALKSLTFEAPDLERFPCLALAIDSLAQGGNMPAVLNAANEELVAAYLKETIGFYDIAEYIQKAMAAIPKIENPAIDDILMSDKMARVEIRRLLELRR
ncbi:1-deoxy-D-xylulose-5-phosphate reductoisomerase [Fusibacter paucivorans]|uniref:1-deoxy-D-xylulose 5-phosphate reductoisomerase n=1 Tax=Fusibacter paucivorans TaxID=76009 RepID=A0ABS5PTX7_9FIRM|nr:1-deoxy-D-xylulose-5-phosphate reductoisomerase [Fusibacter paucivorans]MBS7528016.1 1-deoxy-D-xylulose-5-phosphate reductoisomerase [Fusibacter paucivorans]